jgi:DNA-directed RNA polymerase subunit RPC12/RpoP
MYILKCTNCGNTFRTETVVQGKLVTCPICEAEYTLLVGEGKIRLKEFIFENDESADDYSIKKA